jgi:predicted ester cyclase
MASHREISRRAFDAYTTGDTSGLEDAFTVNHVVHDAQNPFAASQQGLEVLRGQVRMYRAALPYLVMTVDAQYEDGDVVISRWTATGTQTGALPTLPATGRRTTVSGILIDRYEGEQVAETWSKSNGPIGLVCQTGTSWHLPNWAVE